MRNLLEEDHREGVVSKSWFMFTCAWFLLHVRPLNWHFLYKDLMQDLGDKAYHHVWCLCFYLEFETLTKRGREGRAYRKKLRESGEWSGTGQPSLKVNKEELEKLDKEGKELKKMLSQVDAKSPSED